MANIIYPYFIKEEEELYLQQSKTRSKEIEFIYDLVQIPMVDLIEMKIEKIDSIYNNIRKIRKSILENKCEDKTLLSIIEKQITKIVLIKTIKEQNKPIGNSFVQQWVNDYKQQYFLPLEIRDILEVDYYYCMQLSYEDIVYSIERLEQYKSILNENKDIIVTRFISIIDNMIDNYKFTLLKKCE